MLDVHDIVRGTKVEEAMIKETWMSLAGRWHQVSQSERGQLKSITVHERKMSEIHCSQTSLWIWPRLVILDAIPQVR